ncbi:MAG: hypothetical protein HSCHL_1255 [Hydrogenibacillus schlegelii]|uniref:ATP-grasp domain-containing protein n=1 Tax=Hydrogenibacillus schlegelii TaxID=1484 RepID=A0A2T5GCG4_HYDSH|nr:YheC/YheD family protein [Hydrogenibacillus schlegelii]PTQ53881.1 MAG: hypothetical protein HSCHL_1255 [Hydrogenibacillus schlegelii]
MRFFFLYTPCPDAGPAGIAEPRYAAAVLAAARKLGLKAERLAGPDVFRQLSELRGALVYDRTGPCPGGRRGDARRLRTALAAAGAFVIGRPLPDKWGQYVRLNRHPALRPHLPAQRRLDVPEDVFALGVPEVVVKPRAGAFGAGVVALRLVPPYRARGRDGRLRPVVRTFSDRAALFAFLAPALGRAIVQERLSLTDAGGEPFDLRLLVQWETAGGGERIRVDDYVRLGRPGNVASNLKLGGAALPPDAAARRLGRPELLSLRPALTRLARAVADVFSGDPGRIELGLDVGLDREGRLWLLEVNGKPGRAGLLQAYGPARYEKAAEALLRTALARFARSAGRPPEDGEARPTPPDEPIG